MRWLCKNCTETSTQFLTIILAQFSASFTYSFERFSTRDETMVDLTLASLKLHWASNCPQLFNQFDFCKENNSDSFGRCGLESKLVWLPTCNAHSCGSCVFMTVTIRAAIKVLSIDQLSSLHLFLRSKDQFVQNELERKNSPNTWILYLPWYIRTKWNKDNKIRFMNIQMREN